jgi:hypothetical protein
VNKDLSSRLELEKHKQERIPVGLRAHMHVLRLEESSKNGPRDGRWPAVSALLTIPPAEMLPPQRGKYSWFTGLAVLHRARLSCGVTVPAKHSIAVRWRARTAPAGAESTVEHNERAGHAVWAENAARCWAKTSPGPGSNASLRRHRRCGAALDL